MSRFGRRTFMAASAGVAAGAVGAGSLAGTGAETDADAAAPPADRLSSFEQSLAHAPGPLRATGLTVNGLVDPVGVDPDGVSFAWTLQATGREARQTAYRVILRRTDPSHAATVWDSGRVSSSHQAFVGYGGPPCRLTPVPVDGEHGGRPGPGGPAPLRPLHHRLRSKDWQGQWLRPGGRSSQPDA